MRKGCVTEDANFARIWAGRARRVIVLDIPDAARQDLMRFLPKDDLPTRVRQELEAPPVVSSHVEPATAATEEPPAPAPGDLRRRVWSFIQHAPSLPAGRERVGEATSAVVPWPHQVRAFERLYGNWPPRLLIADEVGLGKTIQCRHAFAAGLAGGPGRAHPDPGAQGRAQAVADRTAREIQPQLADLRRPQAKEGVEN